MKRIFLLLICFVSCKLYAQVCTTTMENGVEKRFVSIQTGGKDTIVMGQPFRPETKSGIMVNINKQKDENTFAFTLFLKDPKFKADSVYSNKVSLLFTLLNNQVIKVTAMPEAPNPRYNKGGLYLSASSPVSNDVLNILKDHQVSGILFCAGSNTCIDIPITKKEKASFKNAMTYLLK